MKLKYYSPGVKQVLLGASELHLLAGSVRFAAPLYMTDWEEHTVDTGIGFGDESNY